MVGFTFFDENRQQSRKSCRLSSREICEPTRWISENRFRSVVETPLKIRKGVAHLHESFWKYAQTWKTVKMAPSVKSHFWSLHAEFLRSGQSLYKGVSFSKSSFLLSALAISSVSTLSYFHTCKHFRTLFIAMTALPQQPTTMAYGYGGNTGFSNYGTSSAVPLVTVTTVAQNPAPARKKGLFGRRKKTAASTPAPVTTVTPGPGVSVVPGPGAPNLASGAPVTVARPI